MTFSNFRASYLMKTIVYMVVHLFVLATLPAGALAAPPARSTNAAPQDALVNDLRAFQDDFTAATHQDELTSDQVMAVLEELEVRAGILAERLRKSSLKMEQSTSDTAAREILRQRRQAHA